MSYRDGYNGGDDGFYTRGFEDEPFDGDMGPPTDEVDDNTPFEEDEDSDPQHLDLNHKTKKTKLDRDLFPRAEDLTFDQLQSVLGELKFLIKLYQDNQKTRIGTGNRAGSKERKGETAHLVRFFEDELYTLEKEVAKVIKYYVRNEPTGVAKWLLAHSGIKEMTAASWMVGVDIHRATTPSHIYRYCGMDPNMKWMSQEQAKAWMKEQDTDDPWELLARFAQQYQRRFDTLARQAQYDGQGNKREVTKQVVAATMVRRPYSVPMKTLAWQTATWMVRTHNNKEPSEYLPYYYMWKEQEERANERLEFADQAQWYLDNVKIRNKANKAYYKQGKLPPRHIENRVKRKLVKLFISHFHEHYYALVHGELPARPYVFEHLGHTDEIHPPVMHWKVYKLRKQAGRAVPDNPYFVE